MTGEGGHTTDLLAFIILLCAAKAKYFMNTEGSKVEK